VALFRDYDRFAVIKAIPPQRFEGNLADVAVRKTRNPTSVFWR